MTRITGHSKNVRLRDCPEDCDGNHRASVIDTQKLRQQLAEATPGEWHANLQAYGDELDPTVFFYDKDGDKIALFPSVFWDKADAALICSMKNSLSALLDELERLQEVEKRYYKVGAHEIWEKLNS